MSPSNGNDSHSSTGGMRRSFAARSWNCSGVSGTVEAMLTSRRGVARIVLRPPPGRRLCDVRRGGPEENEFGLRIFKGKGLDAYLQRDGRQRGYTIATWRGRHVAEPTELS